MGQTRPQTSWALCLGPVPGRGQAVHGCRGCCLSALLVWGCPPRLDQPLIPLTAPRTPRLLCHILSGPWTRIPLCSL